MQHHHHRQRAPHSPCLTALDRFSRKNPLSTTTEIPPHQKSLRRFRALRDFYQITLVKKFLRSIKHVTLGKVGMNRSTHLDVGKVSFKDVGGRVATVEKH